MALGPFPAVTERGVYRLCSGTEKESYIFR